LVVAVVYRGGVTTGDFGLRIGEIVKCIVMVGEGYKIIVSNLICNYFCNNYVVGYVLYLL